MSEAYRRIFPAQHSVLPVVHVTDEAQAARNVERARLAGADGCFLINHEISWRELLKVHAFVAGEHPDFWLGVNCLGLRPEHVFGEITESVKGVWTDNAEIHERDARQPLADMIRHRREESGWQGLFFGGTAFKLQRPVKELKRAAEIAVAYMDVITTSGAGTGIAAARSKIAMLREGCPNHALAIASGITPENVTDYLDLADCFLVATGISASSSELDLERMRLLIERVHDYRPTADGRDTDGK